MWASLMGGIRARLVSLVVLAFIPAVLLAMYFASSERAWIASHVRLQAVRAAEDAAETQARGIESTRTLLQGLIRFPEIRTLDPVRCGALLARIKDVFPQYANLAVADGQGHVSCSAEPLKAALSIADSDLFQRVLQTKAFAVGDYTSGRIATRGILPLAYPC